MIASFANLSQWTLPPWLRVESSSVATFDRSYVLLALSMYMIGLIMVASSSMPIAERLFANPFHFIVRHMIYIMLSLGVAALTLQISMHRWHQYSSNLLLLGVILLVVVLIVGRNVNGSTRWIGLGPITIQAAEPAKLFLLLFVSLPS